MKKLVFAVAAALMVSFAASSCGGNEGDAAVKAVKELYEKAEKAKKDDDSTTVKKLVGEIDSIKTKYEGLKLTESQAKELEEYVKKIAELVK